MDTKTLLEESKARFNHNAAKEYLAEKYQNKLIVADQGGLWKADAETISLLASLTTTKVIIVDTFSSPVEVDRKQLLTLLRSTYKRVMESWHKEWQELEAKR